MDDLHTSEAGRVLHEFAIKESYTPIAYGQKFQRGNC